MSKAKTVFHLSANYKYGENDTLSLTFYKTEKSHITVELNDERAAAAHRFLVNLCEEQLAEETDLPVAQCKRLESPKEKESIKDADYTNEAPL